MYFEFLFYEQVKFATEVNLTLIKLFVVYCTEKHCIAFRWVFPCRVLFCFIDITINNCSYVNQGSMEIFRFLLQQMRKYVKNALNPKRSSLFLGRTSCLNKNFLILRLVQHFIGVDRQIYFDFLYIIYPMWIKNTSPEYYYRTQLLR